MMVTLPSCYRVKESSHLLAEKRTGKRKALLSGGGLMPKSVREILNDNTDCCYDADQALTELRGLIENLEWDYHTGRIKREDVLELFK